MLVAAAPAESSHDRLLLARSCLSGQSSIGGPAGALLAKHYDSKCEALRLQPLPSELLPLFLLASSSTAFADKSDLQQRIPWQRLSAN